MPSLAGPTGVVWTPNALVAPMGQLQVMVDYQRLQALSLDVYDGTLDRREDSNLWKGEILAGIADGAELWAAYSKTSGNQGGSVDRFPLDEGSSRQLVATENTFVDADLKTWSAGAKYQFHQGCAPKNWLFAIGADYRKGTGDFPTIFTFEPSEDDFDLTDRLDTDRKSWDVYAVATADLTSLGSCNCNGGKLLGSLGVMWRKRDWQITDHFADLSDGTFGSQTFTMDDRSTTRPFVSLEYSWPQRTSIGVEYFFKGSSNEDEEFLFGDNFAKFRDRAIWSLVLRHEFVGGFTAQVGVTDADDQGFGERNSNWFVGVGYNFGWCK